MRHISAISLPTKVPVQSSLDVSFKARTRQMLGLEVCDKFTVNCGIAGDQLSLQCDKSDEVWEPSVGDSDDTESLNGLGGADQTLPCLTDW